jgi:hypothetical protein
LGEPWIWTDERTGTQIPLSYRGWMGTYDPGSLGISSRDFVLKFGHHLPGGGPGEAVPEVPEKAADAPEDAGRREKADESKEAIEAKRWKLSGMLNVDCMICHSNDHAYSQEAWWNQIQDENFAWAATAALGIGNVDGKVADLDDDFDPATAGEDSKDKLPVTTYNWDASTARRRSSSTSFANRPTTPATTATRRIRSASMRMPIGLGMKTFIFEPVSPVPIATATGSPITPCAASRARCIRRVRTWRRLSCRGCHMNDEHGGGRMGAPKPLHKGCRRCISIGFRARPVTAGRSLTGRRN